MKWTHDEAVELCRQLAPIARSTGFYIALTGGLLYKQGPRKDCDIALHAIDGKCSETEFMTRIAELGIEVKRTEGYRTIAEYNGKPIDFLFSHKASTLDDYGWSA